MTTMHLGERSKATKFYLVAHKEQKPTLILGQTWLHSHQCNINWDTMDVQVTFQGVRAKTSMLHLRTTGPQCLPIPQTTLPKRQRFIKTQKTRSIHHWLPKTLLAAQGFYHGNKQIWISRVKTVQISYNKLQ